MQIFIRCIFCVIAKNYLHPIIILYHNVGTIDSLSDFSALITFVLFTVTSEFTISSYVHMNRVM